MRDRPTLYPASTRTSILGKGKIPFSCILHVQILVMGSVTANNASLRVRSPFSITAIVMAGARVRDGGGPISDVQRLAREHAQRIAVGTFSRGCARVERQADG